MLDKHGAFEKWTQFRLLVSYQMIAFVLCLSHPRFDITRYSHPKAKPFATLPSPSNTGCLKPGSLLSTELNSGRCSSWDHPFLSSLTVWLSSTAPLNNIRRWEKVICLYMVCFISVLTVKKLNFKIVVI